MELDCLTLEIRMLANHLYQRVLSGADHALTMHQGLILGHIIANRDQQITQKEIEELFSIRRSTANHMFQLMEQNGYISRTVSPADTRMKVIQITKSGFQAHAQFHRQFQAFETQLRTGFSDQELALLRMMMRKLWNNAEPKA